MQRMAPQRTAGRRLKRSLPSRTVHCTGPVIKQIVVTVT